MIVSETETEIERNRAKINRNDEIVKVEQSERNLFRIDFNGMKEKCVILLHKSLDILMVGGVLAVTYTVRVVYICCRKYDRETKQQKRWPRASVVLVSCWLNIVVFVVNQT